MPEKIWRCALAHDLLINDIAKISCLIDKPAEELEHSPPLTTTGHVNRSFLNARNPDHIRFSPDTKLLYHSSVEVAELGITNGDESSIAQSRARSRLSKEITNFSSPHFSKPPMTNMVSLKATLILNNRGVELFQSNCIPEAVSSYRQSLCIVRELLQCPRSSSETIAADFGASSTHLPRQESFHSITPHATHGGSTRAMNDELFLYQSPLILQESASFSQNVDQSIQIYCAAILFNTAILQHHTGIRTGNSDFLKRAQQLYQSSLQLVVGLNNSNDTVTLLAVANCNNLALIDLEKGLLMEAGERLRFLANILQTTAQSKILRIFNMDEFQGMLSNTLLRNGMISSPAA